MRTCVNISTYGIDSGIESLHADIAMPLLCSENFFVINVIVGSTHML